MKIMLLAAATLSLDVGAADADNKGNATPTKAALTPDTRRPFGRLPRRPTRRFPRRPLFLLFRRRRAGSRTDS